MTKKAYFAWFTVVTWMAIIFYLSHQPASESSELSVGISALIIKAIDLLPIPFHIDMQFFHFFIRKSAHFFAYFILGVLLFNAFNVSNVQQLKGCLSSIGICIIYAISDEVHQLFIPGRSGQISDVLIDSSGATVGIILYSYLLKIIRKVRDK